MKRHYMVLCRGIDTGIRSMTHVPTSSNVKGARGLVPLSMIMYYCWRPKRESVQKSPSSKYERPRFARPAGRVSSWSLAKSCMSLQQLQRTCKDKQCHGVSPSLACHSNSVQGLCKR
eukprot:jgi/Botrbrau1/7318/Bobra.247_3s0013.1